MTEQPWTLDPRDREPSRPDNAAPGSAPASGVDGRPFGMCLHGYVNQYGDMCPTCDGEAAADARS